MAVHYPVDATVRRFVQAARAALRETVAAARRTDRFFAQVLAHDPADEAGRQETATIAIRANLDFLEQAIKAARQNLYLAYSRSFGLRELAGRAQTAPPAATGAALARPRRRRGAEPE